MISKITPILVGSWALMLCAQALAEVQSRAVTYKDGDTVFEGYLAFDTDKVSPDRLNSVPGVLIVHQWMGLTDYEKMRANQLAESGYVAFALDIYGKDKRPANSDEAGQYAGRFKNDRALYRQRLRLGLDQFKKETGLREERIAAIGYCFGGTGVLELARSGASVAGVVSFHGGLDSPAPQDGKNIKTKILVCHGAVDPYVKPADIEAFQKELTAAHVDWQMIYYSGAVHAFTQKMAGSDPSRGVAYNAMADRRSWAAMHSFFGELFNLH